jgi:glutamate-1-semialdehyde 2,1-aminomutase
MLTLYAGRDEQVTKFEDLDRARFGELFRGLLERGVYIAPSPYECWFPSLAHHDAVVDETIEVASQAVSDVLGR